jgi:hypothetical protein
MEFTAAAFDEDYMHARQKRPAKGRGRSTTGRKVRGRKMTRFRSVALAVGFAAVVAGAVTGTSLRGETREANIAETCSHAAWPHIPAGCLEGGKGRDVRFVTANVQSMDQAMQFRFAESFSDPQS